MFEYYFVQFIYCLTDTGKEKAIYTDAYSRLNLILQIRMQLKVILVKFSTLNLLPCFWNVFFSEIEATTLFFGQIFQAKKSKYSPPLNKVNYMPP